jgi:hypothetical protein
MSVAVLVTDTSPGFITSDDPCIWIDPDVHKRPLMMQATGLQWRLRFLYRLRSC